MDLQTISSQMNRELSSVIQKHQIVVTELRNDPQNPVLQRRLNDLKAEIQSLNDRQKQVVQDLRKNLENKQSSPTLCTNNSLGSVTPSLSLSPHAQNQEMHMFCTAQKFPVQNHKLQSTTVIAKPVTNCIGAARQTVPPSLSSVATPTAAFTFKAPVGTVVLPNCSTAGALLSSKVADSQKVQPVLVVPSPSNRTADGQQTGVLLNLGPPIRVPQYPPLPRMSIPVTCQKYPVVNNCLPIPTSTAPSTCLPPVQVGPAPATVKRNFADSPETRCSPPFSTKTECKIDQNKLDFLSALGLISREVLYNIKNKRLERKRRTTANPQFSNAALEEKLRNAAAAQAAAPPQKRPRGRPPRTDSKTPCSSTNGAADTSHPGASSPADGSSVNGTFSSPSTSHSPLSDSSTIMNGGYRHTTNGEEGKNVEQMLSGLCIVCTQPGDLVKCDTCAKQQHLGCMQPPLMKKPQSSWQCAECEARTVSLIVVQSYDMMKAAKEDEKRKLLKKSLELRLKRSQLEGRLSQLRELSGKQKSRQSELQTSRTDIETLLERMGSVIGGVRLCS